MDVYSVGVTIDASGAKTGADQFKAAADQTIAASQRVTVAQQQQQAAIGHAAPVVRDMTQAVQAAGTAASTTASSWTRLSAATGQTVTQLKAASAANMAHYASIVQSNTGLNAAQVALGRLNIAHYEMRPRKQPGNQKPTPHTFPCFYLPQTVRWRMVPVAQTHRLPQTLHISRPPNRVNLVPAHP
jgi:hypothetical protein